MKVFDKVKNIVAQVHGVAGMPLMYVIRVVLIPEDEKNDPPFGEEDTKYTSVDMETKARALIFSDNAEFDSRLSRLMDRLFPPS
jgi:hypothetical protein